MGCHRYRGCGGEAGRYRPLRVRRAHLGRKVLYERVENHWRHTPQFKQLELRFVSEQATRVASLLTGEAHIAPISSDLQDQVISRGKSIIRSRVPSRYVHYMFTGMYFLEPELLEQDDAFLDIRVRQAMNKAINRQEMIDNLLPGKAELARVLSFHPTRLLGWNPRWEAEWEDEYGYDPDAARQLIQDAGAEGYEFTVYLSAISGFPEFNIVAEALTPYWEAIGLSPQLVEADVAVYRPRNRDKTAHDYLFPNAPPLSTSQELMVMFWSYQPLSGRLFQHETINQLFPQLTASVNPVERDSLLRQIGDLWYDNFVTVPLFEVFTEMAVDPDVVAEYAFPGAVSGAFTHLEYVVPVPK